VVALLAAVLAVSGSGCARTVARPNPRMAQALQMEESGVVAIGTLLEGDPARVTLCSGALVAPNLVLTARHCISHPITSTPSCDARGISHNGPHLGDDVDPSLIGVYVGAHVRVERDVPSARAVTVLHPAGQTLCDADVAFVVLDHPLAGVTVLHMRLNAPVLAGDSVRPVGFGGGVARTLGDRMARDRSTVLSVGPAQNADTGAVLGPREFEVDHATCRGDSGGPALDMQTGEVVGIISRGGSCSVEGNHVYTRVDAYARLAQAAFRQAERATERNLVAMDLTTDKTMTP
jgi:V8-like Glu-specific endopeptidase